MNESPPASPSPPPIDVRQLAFAIRFAFVALILGLSYFSIRGSLTIGTFEQVFKDMLGGRPLPALTEFVVRMRLVFVVVSFLVPLVALGTLSRRAVIGPFYVLGVLSLVTIAQALTIYHAAFGPLSQIISLLSSAP